VVILIGEEFAVKALANRFAILTGADAAAAERYQIEARLYNKVAASIAPLVTTWRGSRRRASAGAARGVVIVAMSRYSWP
jgi:hypothetical protein